MQSQSAFNRQCVLDYIKKNIFQLINNSEVLRLLCKVEDDIEKFDKNVLHYGYLENYFGIIFNIIQKVVRNKAWNSLNTSRIQKI